MERLETAVHRDRKSREAGAEAQAAWDRLETVAPDDRRLARARVVTRQKRGPHHAAFDMLRTRMLRILQQKGWRTVAVTSPTPGCGKTTTCLNLALSLARRPEARVILLELDFVKPQIARLLDLQPNRPISDALTGAADAEACLLRYGQGLALGLATRRSDSAELLQSPFCAEALLTMVRTYAPEVILCDLPPLFALDDALGFAGRTDCALVVTAEGESTLGEIADGVAQLDRTTPVIGVVVTKSAFPGKGYYGRYGYGYER